MRNFSKFLCSPSAVVRFSYYKKYQNSIGLNQTEVYFPYIGIQTPAFQGNTVVCAVREVKPLLSGCSGPSPCAFCLTVPEAAAVPTITSHTHLASSRKQGRKSVCVSGAGRGSGWGAGVQPQLIQRVRSRDCVGEDQDTIALIRY